MVNLVFDPNIHVVASTMVEPTRLREWADDHGYATLHDDPYTPLGGIGDQALSGQRHLDLLPEFAGRFCYRSFANGRPSNEYIANIIEMEHGSVLEHSNVSLAISGVSRSLTHELIRHRAGAAVSQESQRYVDAKDVRFVVPPAILCINDYALREEAFKLFTQSCESSLESYKALTEVLKRIHGENLFSVKFQTMGKKRALEAARSLLPNAAETRLVWTMNMRAARHVIALRGAEGADLEIRQLAVAMLLLLKQEAPLIFADMKVVIGSDGIAAVSSQHPKV